MLFVVILTSKCHQRYYFDVKIMTNNVASFY